MERVREHIQFNLYYTDNCHLYIRAHQAGLSAKQEPKMNCRGRKHWQQEVYLCMQDLQMIQSR